MLLVFVCAMGPILFAAVCYCLCKSDTSLSGVRWTPLMHLFPSSATPATSTLSSVPSLAAAPHHRQREVSLVNQPDGSLAVALEGR